MAKESWRLAESVFPPAGIARRRRRFGRRRRLLRDVIPSDIFMPQNAFDGRCRRNLRGTDVASALKDPNDAAVLQNILVAQRVPVERVMTKERIKRC